MARLKESWLAALSECDRFGFRWGNLVVQRVVIIISGGPPKQP